MPAAVMSVVIPTCNRAEELERCLTHLRRSIELAGVGDIEVVVSDDGVDGLAAKMVREQFDWVRWVAAPRRGPARNRNFGVAQASGRWILFIDDDCVPSEGWIAAFLRAIERGGSIRVFEGRTVGDREQRRMDEEAPLNSGGGCLWACNMAIERSLFELLGGFCELFPHAHEDADLRLRLVEARHAFAFVPDAVVCHPLRRTKGLTFQLGAAKSYRLLIERHPALMGRRPFRCALLNFVRRLRVVMRLAPRLRFRGFGFALGSMLLQSGAELAAISSLRRRLA